MGQLRDRLDRDLRRRRQRRSTSVPRFGGRQDFECKAGRAPRCPFVAALPVKHAIRRPERQIGRACQCRRRRKPAQRLQGRHCGIERNRRSDRLAKSELPTCPRIGADQQSLIAIDDHEDFRQCCSTPGTSHQVRRFRLVIQLYQPIRCQSYDEATLTVYCRPYAKAGHAKRPTGIFWAATLPCRRHVAVTTLAR